MVTKRYPWSYRLDLEFLKKSQNHDHLRKYLEKNCPTRSKPAPQIINKLCFVCTKLLFSGFHLCCDMSGRVSPSSSHLGRFGHQNAKKKKKNPTRYKKHRNLAKRLSLLLIVFVFLYLFPLCSDPGLTSSPKSGPDPKKM